MVGRLHVSSSAEQTDNKGGVFPVWARGRALPVSVSLIDDPFYRLITVYITLIENLPTTPIRGMCVCVSQTQPHPPFFSKFWLVHVANVQVDYADKGRKGHMILAMSSCVVDFAQRATGPGINFGKMVG